MAVARDVDSGVTNGTASSAQHTQGASTITVGVGATFLLAMIEADTSTPGAVSAKWDIAGANQTMTLIGSVVTESGGATPITLALFGLVNPQSGAKLLSHTWPGQAIAVNAYISLISFTGSDTTSVANATEAFNSAHNTTGASAAVSSAASIPSGDMAVAFYGNINGYSNAFTHLTNPGDGGSAIGKDEALTTNSAAEFYSGAGAIINASATQGASGAFAASIVGIKVPGGAAASPFTPVDFSNPRGPAFPLEDRTFVMSAQAQLIGKDKFFGGPGQTKTYDWPNPRGPAFPLEDRTFVRSAQAQLIGKDRFFGGPGQTKAYDYPNPRGAAFPLEDRTFVKPAQVQLIGKDKFFGAAGQVPNYDWTNPIVQVRRPVDLPQPNLLETLLAQLRAPFFTTEWPNPRGYPAPHQPDQAPSLLNALYSTLMASAWCMDGPPWGPTFPISLRTFLHPVSLNLIGKDRFFGGPGQVPTYDWENPGSRRPAPPQEPPPNLLLATLLQIVFPFAQYDWPNPPARLSILADLPPDTLATLLSVIASPFAQYLWPNPPGKEFPVAERTHLNLLQAQLIGQDQFFGAAGQGPNYDWPVPKGYQPGIITNRSHLDSFKLELIGQDQFFGAPGQGPAYDWPNPLTRKPVLTDHLPPNLALTLLQIVMPFAQTDWPNPFGRRWQLADLPPDTLAVLLSVVSAPPFAQYLWPNPPGGQFPIADRTHLNAVQVQLIGQDRFFGGPGQTATYDWPNPLGRRDIAQLTWLINILQNTLTTAPRPFAQTEWPVPRAMVLNPFPLYLPNNTLLYPTPVPPPTTDEPWSGFIANMGRMMGRRG